MAFFRRWLISVFAALVLCSTFIVLATGDGTEIADSIFMVFLLQFVTPLVFFPLIVGTFTAIIWQILEYLLGAKR